MYWLRQYSAPFILALGLHGIAAWALYSGWTPEQKQLNVVRPQAVMANLLVLEPKARPAPAPVSKPVAQPTPTAKPKPASPPKEDSALAEKKKADALKAKQEQEKADRLAEQERERLERQQRLNELAQSSLEQAISTESANLQAGTAEMVAQSYQLGIYDLVRQNWSRPPSARNGMSAKLLVELIPTGEVVAVSVVESSGSTAFDRSAEQAVRRARRFEVPQDNAIFEENFRQFYFLFQPEDLLRQLSVSTDRLRAYIMQKISFVSVVLFSACVSLLVSSATFAAGSLDTIIIDRGVDEPIRVAVVPFKMDPSLMSETNIADIVGFDLARSGQFDPLASENMLSYPSSRATVFFRDWRILKTAYLVIGSARVDAGGRVAVEFELYDVLGERLMLSRRYSVARSQWRDVSHQIADAIYEEVTGIRGAFSTKIMYVLARNAGSPDAVYQLEIADSDGERSRTLFSSREPIMSASWAPDGKRVAYVTFETGRPSIVIQDVNGPYRERLTNFRGINSAPVFSPDGRQLAMVLSKDGDPEIFIMDLATKSLRQVTRHHAIDTEPSWSPDGSSIIFTSDRGGRPQIYQLELSTNLLERLTFRGDYNARARLLPDGKHLVFVHRTNGVFHIAWQDLERDNLQVLTQTALDESPSLAPNGTMLIYATQDRGRGILAVVSIDGSVKYRLPSSSGDVREPAWSPFLDG